jgi:beta-lactamase regulating signal transducer with metallopeptidase domain
MTPLVAVVDVTLIVGAALGIAALLRRQPAALRHWLLAAAIACAAATPLVAPIAPSWHLRETSAAAAPDGAILVSTDVALDPRTASDAAQAREIRTSSSVPIPFALLLHLVWIAGALACLAGLGLGLVRLWRIAASATPVDEGPWRKQLDAARREFGIRRPVALLQSDRASLLVTWGVVRPEIILPDGAAAWTADRIRVVLCHELAHIARGDWLAQMIAEGLRSIYWFNPVLWLAAARLREEGEHACDDAVLGRGVESSSYARHLLDLARTAAAGRRLSVPAQAMLRASSLERRINAMLNTRTNRAPVSRLVRFSAAAALAAATVALAGVGARAQDQTVFSGTTVDAGGRAIPAASLVLKNNDSKYEIKGDRSGQFQFVALPSGQYTLDVDAPGFTPRHETVILSGPTVRQGITLQIAHVEESIRVTEIPTPLQAPPPDRVKRMREFRDRFAARCAQAPDNACLEPPIKLKDVKPVFPSSLAGTTTEIAVRMHAVIGADGAVHDVEVTSNDVPADIASAAKDAVSQWQFEPTKLDGQPVETGMNITVRFAPGK